MRRMVTVTCVFLASACAQHAASSMNGRGSLRHEDRSVSGAKTAVAGQLDSSFVRAACVQPDSVLAGQKECVLLDQGLYRTRPSKPPR